MPASKTRADVSSRTYQRRDTRKDGRKCRSSQCCVAASATAMSMAPTIATPNSVSRATELGCGDRFCALTGGGPP